MMKFSVVVALLASSAISVGAFTPPVQGLRCLRTMVALHMGQGFGEKPVKRTGKSEGQVIREKAANRYDAIAATGGQEYNVFVRQFGSDDKSWLPCGAIAVPRSAQVADAIFDNETALKTAIVRTYPKLKGYEDEFEFGFNLKIYPDDPIDVATKRGKRATGLSLGNWMNTLLSPIDASQAKPPTP
jgi:hypothetical protein